MMSSFALNVVETAWFAQALKDPLIQRDISPILQMRRQRPRYPESPSGQVTQLVSKQARTPFNLVVFSGRQA